MTKSLRVPALILCLSLSINPIPQNTRKDVCKSTLAPTLHAQIIIPQTSRLIPPEQQQQPDREERYTDRDVRMFLAFAATKAVSLTSGIIQLFFLSRNFSLAVLGPASGLAMLVPYLISIPLGRLADRKGKVNLLIAGVLLQTASFLIALCCSNIAGLFLYYLLFALALNIFMLTTRPFASALLKEKNKEQEIPDLISRATALSMRVSAVSTILGSIIAGTFGMEIVFVVSAAFSGLALVFALFLKNSIRKPEPEAAEQQKASFSPFKQVFRELNVKDRQSIKRALVMDILLGGELSIFICFFVQPMLLQSGIGLGLFGAVFFVLNWIQSFGSARSTKLNRRFRLFSRTGRTRVFFPLFILTLAASGGAPWGKVALILFFAAISFVEGVTGVIYDSHIQSIIPTKQASSITALRILVSGASVFAVQTIVGLASDFIPLSTLLTALMGIIFLASLFVPDITNSHLKRPAQTRASTPPDTPAPRPEEPSREELKKAWAKKLGLSEEVRLWVFENYSYSQLKHMTVFLLGHKDIHPERIRGAYEQSLHVTQFYNSRALLASA